MLNKRVEVKELNLVGTVCNYTKKHIWIETSKGVYVVDAHKVTEIKEESSE